MKKVYVAGPMTGIPDYNFPAFYKAEARLQAAGVEAVNPARLDVERGDVVVGDDGTVTLSDTWDRDRVMARDLKAIEGCTGVLLLPGWRDSAGACIEAGHAIKLRKQVYLSVPAVVNNWPVLRHTLEEWSASFETDTGETIVTSATGGMKGTKPAQVSMVPGKALLQVAEHYGRGAKKYGAHNWRAGYPWSLSFDALMRHALAFWSGEDLDPETGSPHMSAVVFHALALLTFATEHPSYDDRYRK